jgi:CheY-like chemotaxis protein/HPt (histidine-containing phosphotransfer) domain-containing protein
VPGKEKGPASRKLDSTLGTRFPLRLLLVDDNLVNQKVAVRLFQQMGYSVDVVNNGLECIETFSKKDYDIVFMDLQMPEMDGLEATRRIRLMEAERLASNPETFPATIIAMTANAMQGDREKCLDAGMDDYVTKPVAPQALQATIERWATERAGALREPRAVAVAAHPKPQPAAEPLVQVVSADSDSFSGGLDSLKGFTDGSRESLEELVHFFLKQTGDQIEQLKLALALNAPEKVRAVAHSCAGSSGTCGMTELCLLLRDLEKRAEEKSLDQADDLVAQITGEFGRIEHRLNSALLHA